MSLKASNAIDNILSSNDIKQSDLAEILGVTKVHLNYVYNGNREASKMLENFLMVLDSCTRISVRDREINLAGASVSIAREINIKGLEL